jgi:hypothetical protein
MYLPETNLLAKKLTVAWFLVAAFAVFAPAAPVVTNSAVSASVAIVRNPDFVSNISKPFAFSDLSAKTVSQNQNPSLRMQNLGFGQRYIRLHP